MENLANGRVDYDSVNIGSRLLDILKNVDNEEIDLGCLAIAWRNHTLRCNNQQDEVIKRLAEFLEELSEFEASGNFASIEDRQIDKSIADFRRCAHVFFETECEDISNSLDKLDDSVSDLEEDSAIAPLGQVKLALVSTYLTATSALIVAVLYSAGVYVYDYLSDDSYLLEDESLPEGAYKYGLTVPGVFDPEEILFTECTVDRGELELKCKPDISVSLRNWDDDPVLSKFDNSRQCFVLYSGDNEIKFHCK